MTGSNGYGATRGGGRLPKPSFGLDAPAFNPALLRLAKDAKDVAAKAGVPPLVILTKLRELGTLECSDEQLAELAELANSKLIR